MASTSPKFTGKVAHCPPGAIIITAEAAQLLTRYFAGCFPPQNAETRRVIAEIKHMSATRPPSRDKIHNCLPDRDNQEVTTREASYLLGISTAAVRKRINRGQLKARHDGHIWLINKTDLNLKGEH